MQLLKLQPHTSGHGLLALFGLLGLCALAGKMAQARDAEQTLLSGIPNSHKLAFVVR
jgi:hypothetical protein